MVLVFILLMNRLAKYAIKINRLRRIYKDYLRYLGIVDFYDQIEGQEM